MLLNTTDTEVAETLANPAPSIRSTEPEACIASFWSPRINNAREASLTPARMAEPAFREAAAPVETTHNSSSAAVAPKVFLMPKSPERVTKPPTVAVNPVTVREPVLSATRSGAAMVVSPMDTETVRSTSAPVLLKATPISLALALAKPLPRLRSTAPVACKASF